MKTEKNLAKVFAMALRKASRDLQELEGLEMASDEMARREAHASIETIAEELDKFAAGGDANDWQGSYELLRDAIEEHQWLFIHEDDVAEEAIYVEAIERAGALLQLQEQAGTCDACGAEKITLLVVESVAGAPGKVCRECMPGIPLREPDPAGGAHG